MSAAAVPSLPAFPSEPTHARQAAGAQVGVTYHTVQLDQYTVFYREAGDSTKLTLLLLHGFPSSSRMWQPLLEQLAGEYHLLAPDYIGFGHSSQPAPAEFTYTFDHLTDYVAKFTEVLHVRRYVLVMQDYGGPVGLRLAQRHPERVQAMIIQNAVSHAQGLSPLWETRKAFWADKAGQYEAVKKTFISLEATRQRHVGSSPHPERIDPDTYTDEYRFLTQPGQAAIQLDLFYDYQSNVQRYPEWQQWLRQHQLPLLVLWGIYDSSFTVAGAWAYQQDVPLAQIYLFEAGHFALDEAAPQLIDHVRRFLQGIFL